MQNKNVRADSIVRKNFHLTLRKNASQIKKRWKSD
jgi:hypothetical protein